MASASTDTDVRSALVHREVIQLVLLIVVAVAAFWVTRAVAASNRGMSLSDAAAWFERGQREMSAGHLDLAVDALRRATVRNRTDRRYLLALAHALALTGDADAARRELLALREAAPEDADINLELARLAAGRDDATEAVRFYHNALYAPWASEASEARRRVRLELVRFLLTHRQPARATAELVALSTDLPDDVSHHLELARLFEQAATTTGDSSSTRRRSDSMPMPTRRSPAPDRRRFDSATMRWPAAI